LADAQERVERLQQEVLRVEEANEKALLAAKVEWVGEKAELEAKVAELEVQVSRLQVCVFGGLCLFVCF
jgi:hypothetical protein